MKTSSFIIFLSIVLLVYGSLNYYIFIRGWQAIPRISLLRTNYLILFLILSSSFFAGRILERYYPSIFSDILVWIGSFWLGAILYFFLIIIFLDILRLINNSFPFFPAFATFDYLKTKSAVLMISILAVFVLLGFGFINAKNPVIKELKLNVNKSAGNLKVLNIVMASDIHLGTIIGKNRLKEIVDKINGLNADIVLLPGDIVDEDVAPVIRNDIGSILIRIKSKYGTYAVTGNHEYIGGVEPAVNYLSEHNINILRDSVLKIDDSFYLVGREDRSISSFAGKKRKELSALLSETDKSLPIILMDHQPFGLDSAVKNGIDMQISGHTHNGQLFPINLIEKFIFELSSGYLKKEQTHFYVSTGVGTWGPPVRIGNRPEIVNIKVLFIEQ
jgi:predicted MPP superfamily phosphohydrolase